MLDHTHSYAWYSGWHAASLCRSCGDHHRAGPRAVPVHPHRREDRRRRGRPGLPRPDPDRAAPRLRIPDARMAAPRHPRESTGDSSADGPPNTATTTNSRTHRTHAHAAERGFPAQDGRTRVPRRRLSPRPAVLVDTFEQGNRAVKRGPGDLQLFRTGDPLTIGQEAPGRSATSRSWSQNAQKADPELRISLLTCVGTAGFEPATP